MGCLRRIWELLLDGKIDAGSGRDSSEGPSIAWTLGVGICFLPLYILFSALRNAGCGTAALCFGGAIFIVVRLRWELRNRIWFWAVITIVVLLHLGMLLLIPWPNTDYTLPVVLPVGIVDILAISYLIGLIAKKMGPADGKQDDS